MAPLRAEIAIARSAALIPIAASPCPGEHHIDRMAIAAGTDKPRAPIDNARHVTVSSSEVRGIGFDLVAAVPAPHDKANNLLRQVVYEGLREDKDPTEVQRPVPNQPSSPG